MSSLFYYMAEWNLFHIDQIRPDREPLSREEAEFSVAGKVGSLLRSYGTVVRHIQVETLDEEDEPIIERYTTLDLQAMMQDDSELFISQLPLVNNETITSKGSVCINLTTPTGVPILDLIVLRQTEDQLQIITSEDAQPELTVLAELVDALHCIEEEISESRPQNQYPADPYRYPRRERRLDYQECPRRRKTPIEHWRPTSLINFHYEDHDGSE